MKLRIISFVLALIMVLGMIPAIYAASHPFKDVPSGQWYSEHVQYVYDKGLMAGTSATAFDPEGTMTRAMVVTVLYRQAGSPATSGNNPFRDVPAGKWYTSAVIWAVENGVTSGTSSTTFSPNDKVTREQLVTFLYRYAAFVDQDLVVGATANLSQYRDSNRVAKYAAVPFGWAVEHGIISGTSKTELSPTGSATRAQCATILSRFDRWMNDEDTESTEPQPTEPAPTEPAPSNPACDHNYVRVMTTDPTCTEPGYNVYFCEKCDDGYQEESGVPALGHKYVAVESENQIDYTCERCGDHYWESTVVIDEAFEDQVAQYVAQYINQFRNEEGSRTCEYLPGMEQVADYRANQLITNFAHDEHDLREACAHYQYGVYHDLTQYGYDESYNYWDFGGQEAIACGGTSNDYDAAIVGLEFAKTAHNSAGHWAYLGDDIYSYIAVGVEYVEGSSHNMGTWYICIMVNENNYG